MTALYWNRRYQTGGSSGPGSRGEEAAFKVRLVNRWLRQVGAISVLDLGCGDGYLRAHGLAKGRPYLGTDYSREALKLAKAANPRTRYSLAPLPPTARFDTVLSLDVLFHLTDEEEYRAYLGDLFGRAIRWAIVYGTNEERPSAEHVRHRVWLPDLPPTWEIVETVPTRFHPGKTAWLLRRRSPDATP